MNHKITLTISLLALSLPASAAFAQEATPKSETQDRPMTEAGEAITDSWITTKVKADLLATDGVTGTGINVDTKDGVVTLTGKVKSKAEADKAVSVARGIKGVTKVESELTASPAASN
jgi:hyperosmotically inducible protein